jgi:carbamate kinase
MSSCSRGNGPQVGLLALQAAAYVDIEPQVAIGALEDIAGIIEGLAGPRVA